MSRKTMLLGMVFALAPPFAGAEATLDDQVLSIQRGLDNKYQIQDLRVKSTATIGGKLTAVAGGTGAAIYTNGSVAADTDYGNVRKTVLTLSSATMPVVNLISSNSTAGRKIYDFPAGRISVLGVTAANLTTATNAYCTSTSHVAYALGTVQATGDSLTGTEVNFLPTNATTQVTNFNSGALASAAQFDGTSTAADLYLNYCIDSNYFAQGITNAISGTVTLHWINLGDY